MIIKTLTKRQENKLAWYRNKWLKIGLSTETFTLNQARPIIDDFYTYILKKDKPELIIILDSPLSTWIAVQLWNQVENQVVNQVENQVVNQVWNQVENQVRNQVVNQVVNQVENQVENQVVDQVWNLVWNQVENQVVNQVQNQVENQVVNQVVNQVENQGGIFVWPYCDGNFSASYCGYYDYIFSELIECECKQWEMYKNLSKLSLIYPFDDVCFLSQKPSKILLENGLLHCDKEAAIKYSDGFSVWALNGVEVPQWLVETKAEEIDPYKILELENAQQRAEGIRKIGMERFWYKCCRKIIDKYGDYELGLIPIEKGTGGKLYPYLKMKNPSVPELWHVEGIPDLTCTTVEQALHSRKPDKMRKIPVSDIGEDWYQQGDVYVWPRNANSLKLYPKILT